MLCCPSSEGCPAAPFLVSVHVSECAHLCSDLGCYALECDRENPRSREVEGLPFCQSLLQMLTFSQHAMPLPQQLYLHRLTHVPPTHATLAWRAHRRAHSDQVVPKLAEAGLARLLEAVICMPSPRCLHLSHLAAPVLPNLQLYQGEAYRCAHSDQVVPELAEAGLTRGPDGGHLVFHALAGHVPRVGSGHDLYPCTRLSIKYKCRRLSELALLQSAE